MKTLLVARFVGVALLLYNAKSQKVPVKKSVGASYRIVNGTHATLGQFPYAISVQLYGPQNIRDHYCTFSLITARTSLGAAHCAFDKDDLMQIPASRYCGIVGSILQTKNSPCHQFSDIILHEGYNIDKIANDIGLFIFKEEIEIDGKFVDTVALTGIDEERDDGKVTAIGWGKLNSFEDENYPKMLSYIQLKLRPRYRCNAKKTQICIETKNEGLCSGDSGGPVIITPRGKPVQVGIASYVLWRCALAVSVATSVGSFVEWIKNNSVGEPTFVDE